MQAVQPTTTKLDTNQTLFQKLNSSTTTKLDMNQQTL